MVFIERKIKYYEAAEYYTIDEYGTIYNHKTNRIVKPTLDQHGYYQVKLYKDNNTGHKNRRRASYLVHRLVACTFLDIDDGVNPLYVGKYFNGLTVDHIDGNKTNNYYKNLRWVSFLDNCNYAKALGYNNPEANYTDISEEIVLKIIDDLCNLYSVEEIMERHSVSRNMVSRIKQKKRWQSLTKDINFPVTYVNGKRDDVLTAIYFSLYSDLDGIKLSAELKKLNIKYSSSQIYNIRNNVSCRDYIKYIKDGKFKPSTTILEAAANNTAIGVGL